MASTKEVRAMKAAKAKAETKARSTPKNKKEQTAETEVMPVIAFRVSGLLNTRIEKVKESVLKGYTGSHRNAHALRTIFEAGLTKLAP